MHWQLMPLLSIIVPAFAAWFVYIYVNRKPKQQAGPQPCPGVIDDMGQCNLCSHCDDNAYGGPERIRGKVHMPDAPDIRRLDWWKELG